MFPERRNWVEQEMFYWQNFNCSVSYRSGKWNADPDFGYRKKIGNGEHHIPRCVESFAML